MVVAFSLNRRMNRHAIIIFKACGFILTSLFYFKVKTQKSTHRNE